ncbi:Centrosomal protein [Liparis tanakae]|uniref:Centrosomal protein n=1 Tax=Liparis tanakae TaxID=230148 RepID=A0A4Z2G4G9_9TELE|nr:Centrosomal protein [Liparis tanakae]
MGTQEGERDWVDVANDLLSKYPIKLRLRKLTDCDANVFTALYENILGEKVPGENVVSGDKESITNLLEIFDGLLEYLKEEISEESQNGGKQIPFSFNSLTPKYVFLSN